MPIGKYKDWNACKADGKTDAYCGHLYHNVGAHAETTLNLHDMKEDMSLNQDDLMGRGQSRWGMNTQSDRYAQIPQLPNTFPTDMNPGFANGPAPNPPMAENGMPPMNGGGGMPPNGGMAQEPCAMCGQPIHPPIDHPYLPAMQSEQPLGQPVPPMAQEHHIPNEGMGEGGMGSGRYPEKPQTHQPYGGQGGGGGAGGGGAGGMGLGGQGARGPQGPIMPPGMGIHETIAKQIVDAKLDCKCRKSK